MSADDYEYSGTLTFSDEELKKELHQIALDGLKAFVDAYESVYLNSETSANSPIVLIEEDIYGYSQITLGTSANSAQEYIFYIEYQIS